MLPTAISRLDKMPVLEQSRDRVLRVLDEESTPHALVTAVESDVALVVAVMRLANATPGRKVKTVGGAVRALTPAGVDALVRRMETYSFFDPMPGWALPPERFRLHAVSVAGIADMIAREIDHPNRGELYLAALLHDIGKVVMAEAYPDYDELTREADCSPGERAQAERLRYGVDHSVIGGVVLRRWRIPQVIAHAVERHHAPQADGAAVVLRLADMLSHYERGSASRPAELEQAAGQLGIEGQQLRSLMYRLTRCGGPRRLRFVPSPLSGHERDALRGIAAAKVYKQIARDLDLAPSTVRSHVHNARSKLGANSRAQAVLIATQHGWV